MVHCTSVYTKGLHLMIYFAEVYFVISNSVDPDEMPHYAAFHLGLQRAKESLVRRCYERLDRCRYQCRISWFICMMARVMALEGLIRTYAMR